MNIQIFFLREKSHSLSLKGLLHAFQQNYWQVILCQLSATVVAHLVENGQRSNFSCVCFNILQ